VVSFFQSSLLWCDAFLLVLSSFAQSCCSRPIISTRWVSITAHGPTGHGSRFIENTAVEQLLELCQKATAFRNGQKALLHGDTNGDHSHKNCSHAVAAKNKIQAKKDGEAKKKRLGDVTSLNITTLEAGVKVGNTFAFNCVPPVARCSLDIRISPEEHEPSDVAALLDEWCRECSKTSKSEDDIHDIPPPVEWSFIGQPDLQKHVLTSIEGKQNPWYAVFEGTLKDMGFGIRPQIFPAATDSRFLRALGIRALGFSPMRSTHQVPCEVLLHENDEHVPEATFLEGIGVYVGLIHALGSKGGDMD